MARVTIEGQEYDVVRRIPDPSYATKRECNHPRYAFWPVGSGDGTITEWLIITPAPTKEAEGPKEEG